MNSLDNTHQPANCRQVGGTHYASPIQHWDYVLANGLDYFQGQITKYVARWKMKGGLSDLQKALHFLQKYIEVNSPGEVVSSTAGLGQEASCQPPPPPSKSHTENLLGRTLTPREMEEISAAYEMAASLFTVEGHYGDGFSLFTCKSCGSKLVRPNIIAALQDHFCGGGVDPTSDYVDQDRGTLGRLTGAYGTQTYQEGIRQR